MIQDELQAASYRGAFFFLSTAATAGGRKDSLKEIVNSDNQIVEDLGKRQRTFTLTGMIAPRLSNEGAELISYREARDTLLDALEQGGPGQLIHPFLGTIDNVVCRTFSFTESMTAVGASPITITFAITNTTGAPEPEEAVLGTVDTASTATDAALEAAVAGTYAVTNQFAGNFRDAVSNVEEISVAVKGATDPLAQVADEVNGFAKQVSDLAADAASLVASPAALAESVRNLVNSINGLLATPDAVFDAMRRLFDFDDLEIRFSADTAGSRQRDRNRDLLRNQVQATALSEAYVSAAQLDLPTVESIDRVQVILEDQYQKIIATGTLESDSENALTETRLVLTEFFDSQRETKPRIIQVETNTVPTRVLAYSYYGSSELSDTLAELNDLNDSAFIEGTVDILSA